MRKLFLLVAVSLLLSLLPVHAEGTYEVTVYGGNWGTINGSSSVSLNVKEGANVYLELDVEKGTFEIEVDGESHVYPYVPSSSADNKYRARGIKETGYDNDDSSVAQSFTVTAEEDLSYVLTYGIPGDLLEYTVRYVDSNGNNLLSPATFHGTQGEEITVAPRYVADHLPAEGNQTFVLDASGKTITFTYNRATGGTTYIYETVIVPGGGGTAGGGGGTAPVTPATPVNPDEGGGETPEIPDEPTPLDPGTTEEPVITDEPVPLDPGTTESPEPGTEPGGSGSLPSWVLPATGGVLGIGILGLLIAFLRRRKKDIE